MEFANEYWKEIAGYSGRYQVSNYGRIRNTVTNKYMKPQIKKTGYYQINLMKENKEIITERVHRIVALYFCPKKEGCNVVNHIDSNKANNYYKNLEWTTISGNTKHCFEHNEKFKNQVLNNSKKGSAKRIYTVQVFNLNNKCIGIFNGYKEAAKALGVNEKTVRNIIQNKFHTNRNGYTINVIAKGGDAI